MELCWLGVDPLAETTMDAYGYCYQNPINLVDPTGMFSTHTDENGNVVSVFKDGDKGVYRHGKNADGGSVTEYQLSKRHDKLGTSAGGEKMGETEYIDEFINPGTNRAEGKIVFGNDESWEPAIAWGKNRSDRQDLSITANESKNGKILDLKASPELDKLGWIEAGPMTGRLLNGKYATARSAGNYLAGLNGVTGTFQGERISGDTFMKLAGALQQRKFTPANAFLIVTFGKSFGPAPYYGEENYSGRRIQEGINAGLKTLK